MNHTTTRRQFLQQVAAFSASVTLTRSAFAANDKIQVGIVGLGSRGFNLLDAFLTQPDAQIVALCDVHPLHHRDLLWGKGRQFGLTPAADQVKKATGSNPFVTPNYEDLCARDDLDVIVVATPDHWHALCTMNALKAGKDVYCEKPVTHLFREGQLVIEEIAKQKAVFQTGSQQRSDPLFHQALGLIEAGRVGKLERIEVGLPGGYPEPQGDTAVTDIPYGLDYDRWCGPAPKLPYMRARHHRWWRGHTAYGGGVLMDWIGHHNDIAQLSLGTKGPRRVTAVGWEFPETPVYNTPRDYTIACEYEGGVTSTISNSNTQGVKWFGEEGWVYVRRGKLEASNSDWLKGLEKPSGPEATIPHVRNFLDCVKSRETCIAPAHEAHRSITPGHLGYVSSKLQRPLNWDAEQEVIVDDKEADALLKAVTYREGYSLPS